MKSTNRRHFIKQTCPLLIASIVGGEALVSSCSKEKTENPTPISGGYQISDQILTIDLNHADFEPLNSKGWINFLEQNVLRLKSNGSYSAYTNVCPHEGTRNRWSYSASENTFLCSNHDKTYKADCKTAGSGGVLKCYSTQLSNNQLKINLS